MGRTTDQLKDPPRQVSTKDIGLRRFPVFHVVVEFVLVRPQLKDQVADIENKHDGRVDAGQRDFFLRGFVTNHCCYRFGVHQRRRRRPVGVGKLSTQNENGRKERPGRGHEQHAHADVARRQAQFLDLPAQTANDAGDAKHENHVGDHAAEHGELDDAVKAAAEGRHGDEQFRGVAEGGVEQGADGAVGV